MSKEICFISYVDDRLLVGEQFGDVKRIQKVGCRPGLK